MRAFTQLLSVLFILTSGVTLQGQALDFMNKVAVTLSDGTTVVLYGAARLSDNLFSGEYYYLPVNLRLSRKEDKTPQFLFMKYTSENRADAGGLQGALLHFLMEWGLTPAQENEAQNKLIAKLQGLASSNPKFRQVTNPKVMGPVNLKTDPENSFQIISGILTDKKFTPNLVTSGRAPLVPGGKVAVGAILEKNAAQLLAATFEKSRSITDVSVSLRFKYDLLMPAVQGKITVDWQKVDSLYQKYVRNATREDQDTKRSRDDVVKDTSMDNFVSLVKETKVVNVELISLQPDSEIGKEMINAFMEYFVRSVTEKEFRKPEDGGSGPGKNPRDYDYAYNTYKVNQTKLEYKKSIRKEVYNLNVRLPITQEHILTENLASWYDGVRDNKKCVNFVNLNDPFFEHRDINVILDLDAEDMFGKELNYATVNIRKRRTQEGANDFSQSITFDQRFFKEVGNRALVTYSKAQDADPDVYEYKVQWSLRGGNVFPNDTTWTKGTWAGLTLAPPVAPVPMRFEASIEDLKNLEITNVALQLRYYKFKKEVESIININTGQGVGYVEKNIYMDRNTNGYAYRLIFTHKTRGNLATKWEAKMNTGYAYAVVPDELRNNLKTYIDEAINRAKDFLGTGDGKEAKGTVLDQFKDLIKTKN